MSKSGAKGKLFRGPLALAGNRGFQPQRKPPVHTGGFIFLDCPGNNQQTKTDRFTERSAIKTPSVTRSDIAGNWWKRKTPQNT